MKTKILKGSLRRKDLTVFLSEQRLTLSAPKNVLSEGGGKITKKGKIVKGFP